MYLFILTYVYIFKNYLIDIEIEITFIKLFPKVTNLIDVISNLPDTSS